MAYTLHKKAFECTYYQWWEVTNPLVDHAFSEIVYADTPSKARYEYYRQACDNGVDLTIIDVRVRRAKYMDLMIGAPHEQLSALTEMQINKMKHAIGFDSFTPFYRNYYQVHDDADWNDLVGKGLSVKGNQNMMNYYSLNDYGKEVISTLIPKKRNHLFILEQLTPQTSNMIKAINNPVN